MAHRHRRRRARAASVLLGVLILVAFGMGRASSLTGPLAERAARADTIQVAPGTSALEPRAEPVYVALNRERTRAGLATLKIDADLVATAARDACAMARGDIPLSGDRERLSEAGGHSENTGLVIDDDPDAGARTMHAWWTRTRVHRRDRMDPQMVRYGIGACNAEDRTYYVERFAR